MLIVLSGTDCAGKSTQIDLLKNFFSKKEDSVRVLWARGGYTPIFTFLKDFLRRLTLRQLPSAGHSKRRDKAFKRAWLARLWLNLAIVDLILFWCVYLRLQLFFGRVVICDRYIDDTFLDFRFNFPEIAFEKIFFWRVLEFLIPTPNVSFLLWVPVLESLRRSREKFEPFPDDYEALCWRLNAYQNPSLFPSHTFVRLDGRRTIEDLRSFIIATVEASSS